MNYSTTAMSFFPKLRRGHGRMDRRRSPGSKSPLCSAEACELNNPHRKGVELHRDPAANRVDWLISTGQAFNPIKKVLVDAEGLHTSRLVYTRSWRGL